jgi:GntP family gluconate:H+ symporter
MDPLLIVLSGMLVAIGGILVLKLHAFLALTAGALLVALLTPDRFVYLSEAISAAVPVVSVDAGTGRTELRLGQRQSLVAGRHVVLRENAMTGELEQAGEVELSLRNGDARTVAYLQSDAGQPAVRVTDRILHHTQHAAAKKAAATNVGERLAAGFGDTCAGIGILIAMAAIIGKCLLDSGAAEKVVLAIRAALGEKRAPAAFVVSGFIMGIPVFYDTVFYLMIPLGKALAAKTNRNYLLYVLSIVIGATLSHSLVPPTPGPLLVANELGVRLGTMIVAGIVVGAIGCSFGFVYAIVANRVWDIPLRPSAELPREQLEEMARRDPGDLPPFWLSLMPIALPVVLLAGNTVLDVAMSGRSTEPSELVATLVALVGFLGDKNIALTISAAVALLTLVWWKRTSRSETLAKVQDALASGGVIILITAAGGAFGHVLQQTNVAAAIAQRFPITQSGTALLVMAFVVTALVRVAQGSATVAMITGVSIVGPLAASMTLPYHVVYVALAIGCGSKPLPWMNDSGFWISSKMSGMTEAETLKTYTVVITLMGFVCMGATLLGAKYVPLVQATQ